MGYKLGYPNLSSLEIPIFQNRGEPYVRPLNKNRYQTYVRGHQVSALV
jgi:hypothetical protein